MFPAHSVLRQVTTVLVAISCVAILVLPATARAQVQVQGQVPSRSQARVDSTAQRGAALRVTTLTGTIRDERNAPVKGARVSLAGTGLVSFSTQGGRYRFAAIAPGRYTLHVARLGRAPQSEVLEIPAGDSTSHDVQLTSAAVPLSQVTITPGSFTLLDQASASRLTLSRDALRTAPQLAEDVFRSLGRLPGLSGSDFSARIRVRNGGVDEQLVTLDGLELLEPFHLKDFDGALSILDGESIGRVAITTGGFTAASGNRLTGLIDMKSASPADGRSRAAIGLSLSNLRARTEGGFAAGRGAWMASARSGYLDLLFKLLREANPPDPRYSDLFGKVTFALTAAHTVSVEALVAGDRMTLTDSGGSSINSAYANRYLWSTLRSRVGDRFAVSTLLSLSSLSWTRDGLDVDRIQSKSYERTRLVDQRSLSVWSFKQDWTADLTPMLSVLAGGEVRSEAAAYAYSRAQRIRAVIKAAVVVVDSTIIDARLTPSGVRTSAYVSLRAKPVTTLTAEVGVRMDHHQWTRQATVAPRVNASWLIGSGTTLRAAWGLYDQAHALQDLSVVDGDTAFVRAERAEQQGLGIEHELGHGWTARGEAYQRLIASPRARYFNVDGTLDVMPESAPDRVRFAPTSAAVRGVELLARYDAGRALQGGVSLALSRATAVTNGRQAARPYDEPLSATGDLAYRGSGGWTIALAWTAHTGWPSAPPNFVIDTLGAGRYVVLRKPSLPYFGQRLATYQRFDVRATKSMQTRLGRMSMWADIFNLLDHHNQRGVFYRASLLTASSVKVTPSRQDFLGILPSAGIGWEF